MCSADCAEMEAKLEICVIWSENHAICSKGEIEYHERFDSAKGKQAARRIASLKVAAELGRGRDEKD